MKVVEKELIYRRLSSVDNMYYCVAKVEGAALEIPLYLIFKVSKLDMLVVFRKDAIIGCETNTTRAIDLCLSLIPQKV